MFPVKAATVGLAILAATPVFSADLTKEEVKKLALEAILENPEIIREAVEILQQRDQDAQAKAATVALSENMAELTSVENASFMGNPEGDVTIVEFFDYNCGFCKRSAAHVQELLESDKNIRVIYREFPILSESSVTAAKASLAAREQGKYERFHWMLMGARGLNDEAIFEMADEAGLDVDKLKSDMESPKVLSHIENSHRLASAMGISGTPSFIIGNQLVPGYVPMEEMNRIIAEERSDG